ncbi:MAG: thioesterase family protein [Candidatus Eremiobacteraeota bacterium]|nr:thioesterase family protein [Candidatus Eremiobacteraeota bacterium]
MSTLAFESYYESLGDDRYAATRATESPWDRRLQHGSPPTTLLVHAIERAHPRADARVARVNVEFLGPIPRDVLRVRTSLVRPGRRIEMLEATLEGDVDGRPVATARVWRIAVRADAELERRAASDDRPAELPATAVTGLFGIPAGDWGYADAMEWRFARGGPEEAGPATVWARARIPLVAGEPISALERILIVADSANGVSFELPFSEWLFVPPTLSIALQRYAVGEWVRLEAHTALGPDGLGVTTFTLADLTGYLGGGTQALLVERRGAG